MKLPFEQAERRRLYLVRHGEAAEADPKSLGYSTAISLTQRGQAEAQAMRRLLADVAFDRAGCSGVRRAQETAEIILAGRSLALETLPRFHEIRGDQARAFANITSIEETQRQFAYLMNRANRPDTAFLGGEIYDGFMERIAGALLNLAAEPGWSNMLLVAHSGVNRAALCWTLGLDARGLAAFELDSCGLNVIDLDIETETGNVLRKMIRAVNVTPLDITKDSMRLTDGEVRALRLAEILKAKDGAAA